MNEEPNVEAQLEELRGAVALLRFPLLIMGSLGLLLMVVYGLGLLAAAGMLVMSLTASYGPSFIQVVVQLVIMFGLYVAVLIPTTHMFRAGFAGIQGRSNPVKYVAMMRFHEKYWNWMAVLMAIYLVLMVLFYILVVM